MLLSLEAVEHWADGAALKDAIVSIMEVTCDIVEFVKKHLQKGTTCEKSFAVVSVSDAASASY